MVKRFVVVSLIACFACMTGFAQEPSSLNGNWVAKFPSASGQPREAKLVISNGAGTYQLLAKSRDDPCVGREAPIVISNVSSEGFELGILASKALTGCRDSQWQAKRVDDKTYEGVFGDGRKFMLTRQ